MSADVFIDQLRLLQDSCNDCKSASVILILIFLLRLLVTTYVLCHLLNWWGVDTLVFSVINWMFKQNSLFWKLQLVWDKFSLFKCSFNLIIMLRWKVFKWDALSIAVLIWDRYLVIKIVYKWSLKICFGRFPYIRLWHVRILCEILSNSSYQR